MKVLSLDPGTNESAYIVWDGVKIHDMGIKPNVELIDMLGDVSLFGGVDVFAIENFQCLGMIVGKEVFQTCIWVGRFYEAIRRSYGRIPRLIYRQQVKLYHCQSARAKDANIRAALIDKYGAPGTVKKQGVTYGLKSHLWSAFAIGTYVAEVQTEK